MICTTPGCTIQADIDSHLCPSCLWVGQQATTTPVKACSRLDCRYPDPFSAWCEACRTAYKDMSNDIVAVTVSIPVPARRVEDQSMADKYPKYYKRIPKGWTVIDVYGVCKLFPVADDTGCIHHALKKLLVPGVRTGGKAFADDIKEARDTLTRWLELNQ